MPIDFVCPHCYFRPPPAPDHAGGQLTTCVSCARSLTIPFGRWAPPAPAPLPPEPAALEHPPGPHPAVTATAVAPPLPTEPPRVVVWRPEPEPDDADEPDDDPAVRRAASRARRLRAARAARAQVWFWAKLAAIVFGLAGIAVGIALIRDRLDDLGQQKPAPPKAHPRR